MQKKWLEMLLPKPERRSDPESPHHTNESATGREKENSMSRFTPPTHEPAVSAAREVPDFQVDLSSIEDIYRSAREF